MPADLGLSDVLEARKVIHAHIGATPAHSYPSLNDAFGAEIWVKHENHHPTNAFKVRGGINLCARLSAREKKAGVVAASTGNHGQSLAWAARLFGIPASIFVPEAANPDKVRAIKSLGARVTHYGADYEACREYAEGTAKRLGARFVSGGNEPHLIAGVGTYALELFEVVPDLDRIYVPIGGGSGACGCCLVANAVNPATEIIGVQAENAPAVYKSWKSGSIVKSKSALTFAEGLATLAPFEYTLSILRRRLNDFQLVSEHEMQEAIKLLFLYTHNIAEGAGAAAFAAAYRDRKKNAGKKVAIIQSGGNLTWDALGSMF